MAIHFHEEDLPSANLFASDAAIAVDTEAMGLVPGRDRLCLVQLSDGSGDEHLVRFASDSNFAAPNLKALLADPERLKLYHLARFDVAIMHTRSVVRDAPGMYPSLVRSGYASRVRSRVHDLVLCAPVEAGVNAH